MKIKVYGVYITQENSSESVKKVFVKKLIERGIKAEADSKPVRVDKAYLEKYLGANWASEH